MKQLFRGDVHRVQMLDADGQSKFRPGIILDEVNMYSNDDIYIMSISSSLSRPLPFYHIPVLPIHHAKMGLDRPSWIKVNWVASFRPGRIGRLMGAVPDDLLEVAMKVFDNLMDNDKFDKWM